MPLSRHPAGNRGIYRLENQAFYTDSKAPTFLIELLKSGGDYCFKTEGDVEVTHKISASLPNAEPHCYHPLQQKEGYDCGYWALLNSIMVVLIGTTDYLTNNFTERTRSTAYALRALFKLPEAIARKAIEQNLENDSLSTEVNQFQGTDSTVPSKQKMNNLVPNSNKITLLEGTNFSAQQPLPLYSQVEIDLLMKFYAKDPTQVLPALVFPRFINRVLPNLQVDKQVFYLPIQFSKEKPKKINEIKRVWTLLSLQLSLPQGGKGKLDACLTIVDDLLIENDYLFIKGELFNAYPDYDVTFNCDSSKICQDPAHTGPLILRHLPIADVPLFKFQQRKLYCESMGQEDGRVLDGLSNGRLKEPCKKLQSSKQTIITEAKLSEEIRVNNLLSDNVEELIALCKLAILIRTLLGSEKFKKVKEYSHDKQSCNFYSEFNSVFTSAAFKYAIRRSGLVRKAKKSLLGFAANLSSEAKDVLSIEAQRQEAINDLLYQVFNYLCLGSSVDEIKKQKSNLKYALPNSVFLYQAFVIAKSNCNLEQLVEGLIESQSLFQKEMDRLSYKLQTATMDSFPQCEFGYYKSIKQLVIALKAGSDLRRDLAREFALKVVDEYKNSKDQEKTIGEIRVLCGSQNKEVQKKITECVKEVLLSRQRPYSMSAFLDELAILFEFCNEEELKSICEKLCTLINQRNAFDHLLCAAFIRSVQVMMARKLADRKLEKENVSRGLLDDHKPLKTVLSKMLHLIAVEPGKKKSRMQVTHGLKNISLPDFVMFPH